MGLCGLWRGGGWCDDRGQTAYLGGQGGGWMEVWDGGQCDGTGLCALAVVREADGWRSRVEGSVVVQDRVVSQWSLTVKPRSSPGQFVTEGTVDGGGCRAVGRSLRLQLGGNGPHSGHAGLGGRLLFSCAGGGGSWSVLHAQAVISPHFFHPFNNKPFIY